MLGRLELLSVLPISWQLPLGGLNIETSSFSPDSPSFLGLEAAVLAQGGRF